MEQESIQIGRAEQEALVRSVSMMSDVSKRMKQIPVLPSEIPTDNHPLTRVEFPEEDGVLTYMAGYDYPYRGYPYYEFVDKIDIIKKISRGIQSGFYHGLKQSKLKWLLIALIPTLGRSVFWAFCYSFDRLVARTPMRVNRFSESVRELHRAASISWGDETQELSDLRKMLRNIECMILEFDNAYRFRFQDLVVEIDKDALRKNPRKEINRLMDIWISRESVEDVKNSWVLLKLFNNWYLRFDRGLRQMIVRVLLELDPEKCKLSVEDKYFATPRVDYIFGFMLYPTADDTKLIKKVRLQKAVEKETAEIQKRSTFEHNLLKQVHLRENAPESKIKDEIEQLDNKFQQELDQVERNYLEQKEL